MDDLRQLPKFRDSLSYLYVEHCRVDREQSAIALFDQQGETRVPAASLAVLMLGPGTRITHAAMHVLAESNCLALWCGEKGQPGYTCTIDATRGDKDSQWSDEGGATLIANKSPFNASAPDRVKVTVGKYVSIDFTQTQSLGRCGAGAELPRAIVIPARQGKCRVWLEE